MISDPYEGRDEAAEEEELEWYSYEPPRPEQVKTRFVQDNHTVENQCGRCLRWRLAKVARYGYKELSRWFLCDECAAGINVPVSRESLAEIWHVPLERISFDNPPVQLALAAKATVVKIKKQRRRGTAGQGEL